MSKSVQKAAALLVRIRQQIEDCFPVAMIEETFDRTGSVYFRIERKPNRYTVIVTNPFLEANGGVDAALNALGGLEDALERLDPDHVLVVSPDGIALAASSLGRV
jgi:hypothetical protein